MVNNQRQHTARIVQYFRWAKRVQKNLRRVRIIVVSVVRVIDGLFVDEGMTNHINNSDWMILSIQGKKNGLSLNWGYNWADTGQRANKDYLYVGAKRHHKKKAEI